MIKPGHIRIKEKVYFEYYLLKKPDEITLLNLIQEFEGDEYEAKISFLKKVQEYESSKQLIEVSNVEKENDCNYGWLESVNKGIRCKHLIKDNQHCKAEVNGTATIIELNK